MQRLSVETRGPAETGRRLPKASVGVCILCLLASLALIYPPLRAELLRFEHWTADWRTMLLSDRVAGTHPEIAVVLINKETLAASPYQSPTPRDLLANVIRTIDSAGPRSIGLDIYFMVPTDHARDKALLDTLKAVQTHIVMGAVNEHDYQFGPVQRDYQKRFLAEVGKPAGHIGGNLPRDKDGVLRYTAIPGADYPESFALRLARANPPEGRSFPKPPYRIAWLLGPDRKTNPFLTIPAHELLAGGDEASRAKAQDRASQLKGKIVLIGPDRPYEDRHRTPFSAWAGDEMLGVMVHANILAQLIDGRVYSELNADQTAWLLIGLGLLGFLLSWRFWHRRLNVTSKGLVTVALVGLDALIYSQMRIILPFTLALVAWFIGVNWGHHLRTLVASRFGEHAP